MWFENSIQSVNYCHYALTKKWRFIPDRHKIFIVAKYSPNSGHMANMKKYHLFAIWILFGCHENLVPIVKNNLHFIQKQNHKINQQIIFKNFIPVHTARPPGHLHITLWYSYFITTRYTRSIWHESVKHSHILLTKISFSFGWGAFKVDSDSSEKLKF